MDFFGIGISELFFIVFFCLIFFKPEELPGIVRSIVAHVKKFRTMSVKVKREIGDIYHREVESKFEEAKELLDKETIEFRSKLDNEYHHINHSLENIQKDVDISKEVNKVVEETTPIEKMEALPINNEPPSNQLSVPTVTISNNK